MNLCRLHHHTSLCGLVYRRLIVGQRPNDPTVLFLNLCCDGIFIPPWESCNLILSVTELPVKHCVLINLLVILKSIWGVRWSVKNLYNPCPQQSFAHRPISVWFYHLNLTVCRMLSGPNPYCLIPLLAHAHKVFQSKFLGRDFSVRGEVVRFTQNINVWGNWASANQFLLRWKMLQ